jgi:3-deoxy-manno-octulosonate cytidylyltransferase (CMP-KDO synthetase)
MIDESLEPILKNPKIDVVNLMSSLKNQDEHEDPNEVKVVTDLDNFALYFSREPIPSKKKGAKEIPMLKQVCIIPFRRDFLIKFNELEPTPLEIIESVDMLRILEHGYKVKMVPTDFATYSVDTQEDLDCVERCMREEQVMSR